MNLPIGIAVESPAPGARTVRVQPVGSLIVSYDPDPAAWRTSSIFRNICAILDAAAILGQPLPTEPFRFEGGQVFYRDGKIEEARLLLALGTDEERAKSAAPPRGWLTRRVPTLGRHPDGTWGLAESDVGRTHISAFGIDDPNCTGKMAVLFIWDLRANAPPQAETPAQADSPATEPAAAADRLVNEIVVGTPAIPESIASEVKPWVEGIAHFGISQLQAGGRLPTIDALTFTASRRPEEAEPGGEENMWVRRGQFWEVRDANGPVHHLKDAVGVRYLAMLLAAPRQQLSVFDMKRGLRPAEANASHADISEEERASEHLRLRDLDDVGVVADDTAIRAYRERIREIDENEIHEAESSRDYDRVTALKKERDDLEGQISGALGKEGPRKLRTHAERVRKSVRAAIEDCLGRLKVIDQKLELHLRNSLRLGLYCLYQPEPLISWRFNSPSA